jgi:hypothetical protein
MMPMTIWKYPLRITDEQILKVPENASALHVGAQDDDLCLWVLLDPEAPLISRTVRIYGTGHPLDGDLAQFHVGTAQVGYGVWHVFWSMD